MPVRALQPTRWLAQRLGLSVSTIERLRARGDRNLPPHVLIGPQTIRYDEAVVEAWLAARMGWLKPRRRSPQRCRRSRRRHRRGCALGSARRA